MKNSNMHKARASKNDEFYTLLSDIENELKHYKRHFKGKVVYCNCDHPDQSNFFKYFAQQFEALGLKKLIATSFNAEGRGWKMVVEADEDGDGKIDLRDAKKVRLKGNGDFASEECVELLQEADIIVTNPPFSLFRDFVDILVENDKKFLIVGNMNAITYKNVFTYIQDNQLWLGINNVKEFITPEKEIKKFGNINWFTNLTHRKRNEEITLFRKYNPKDYPKYDNYDAIEVSKVSDIPVDYKGTMGVPITFLTKYNPEQFEIRGTRRWLYDTSLGTTNGKTILKGKETYDRIFIKKK